MKRYTDVSDDIKQTADVLADTITNMMPEPDERSTALIAGFIAAAIDDEREQIIRMIDNGDYTRESYEENTSDMLDNIIAAIRRGEHK